MKAQKGQRKHVVIAVFVAALFLTAAAFIYAYGIQPTQPIVVNQVPQSVDSKRVVAVGDIVCAPTTLRIANVCKHDLTASVTEQLKPDAVLLLGDLQYETGELSNFKSAYEPSWGRFNHIAHPTPGNHEYSTKDAAGYFDYFGARAGDRDKGYYSFDLGAWHIISLNSNCGEVGCTPDSPQGKWLKNDLANTVKVCSLAFWHHPAFTSGRYTTRPSDLAKGGALWQQVAGRVDVVLVGHDHIYERFAPLNPEGAVSDTGTRQFTVGTGGRSLYNHTVTHPAGQMFTDSTFGVLAVDLNAESYSWQFASTDGSIPDKGNQACTN